MHGKSFYSKDFHFLVNIQRNPIPLELRIDLGSIWQELQEQYNQAKELDKSWHRYLMNNTSLDAHAGEAVLLVNNSLRTAIVTRDNLLRLTQRLVLLDGIHLALYQAGKLSQQAQEEWERMKSEEDIDPEGIIEKTDETIRRIENIIDEIDFEISEAKKSLHRGKCHPQTQLAEDAITSLEESDSCMEPEEEMENSEIIETEVEHRDHNMEIEAQDEPHYLTKLEEQEESLNAEELSDDDYLRRLIHENSGENEEKVINSQEGSQYVYQQKRSIQDIGKDLDDLERGLRLLPTRRIRESSSGIEPW
ncbi:hypothetical protein GCK32_022781, partial [Trichostrongylus colubriformis]